jgi:thiol:disulfide interchange protein
MTVKLKPIKTLLLSACIALTAITPVFAAPAKSAKPEAVTKKSSTEIAWLADQAVAVKRAKAEHKFVLIDVYTNWCEYCKVLDKDIISKSTLRDYLQRQFVCVKMNGEDEKAGTALAKQYKMVGYPVTLVLNEDGDYIGKVTGYTDINAYMHALQDITFANDSSKPKNH